MNNELIDAIQKLESLCASGDDLAERKMQLAVLVEQFRLQGLYNAAKAVQSETECETERSAESEQARNYLEPLGLAQAGTPISELARLAALRIIEKN
ncbi:hypothetical protein FACS1894214_2000 [Planctomycetales bacterium]|nr:hypothetical protein FACS1894214_2000 [Planctomycetales bacterium]